MSDNQLLLALSDMMDSKLKPLSKEIKQTKVVLEEKIELTRIELHGEIIQTKLELREEIQKNTNAIMDLQEDVKALEEHVERLEEHVERLEEHVERLEKRVEKLEDSVVRLEKRVNECEDAIGRNANNIIKINIMLENSVVPRLDNIESCYVATSNRYINGIDQISSIQSDVNIIKNVVTEHSIKLQKIC